VKPFHFILAIAVLSVLVGSSFAQRNPAGTQCPGTRVIASSERVVDGESVSFQLEILGGNLDRSLLQYQWYVERGRIVSGQGTPVIIVDTTGQGPAGSVTATVAIGGPYPDCCLTTSESSRVRRKGELTKADIFWEWFFETNDRFYSFDSPYKKNEPENFEDLTARLREVDSKLTFKILAIEKTGGPRKLMFGYAGNPKKDKVVDDLIARAPFLFYWKFVKEEQK
jgi:hypothetical protein